MSYRENADWKAARAALVYGAPGVGPIDNLLFRLTAIEAMCAIETAGGGAS